MYSECPGHDISGFSETQEYKENYKLTELYFLYRDPGFIDTASQPVLPAYHSDLLQKIWRILQPPRIQKIQVPGKF